MAFFFGVVVPYAALAIFLAGVVLRVVTWARSPVPFRIPTTCGQQKSLPWIKDAKLENPATTWGVLGRMALEVLLFRSLMRNTRAERHAGPKVAYHWQKWLWLAALGFHWSLLVIVLRHLRLALQPVPAFVRGLAALDSFFQIGLPGLYMTDVLIVLALSYLLLRRVVVAQVRYISLPTDYFLPLLILSVAGSGILMRYFYRVDITAIKELVMGLAAFSPRVPAGIGLIFYVHVFLVSTLLAYIPFSKVVHLAGVFLSPTRNLTANSREVRHVNPWNYPVPIHTYHEYEEEFRDKMRAAGLPVEGEGA